jgi:hypothetical protein
MQPPALVEMDVDDEYEEEVDFWGGSSPRDQTIERGGDGGGDEEEEEENEDMDEDMEDDTDDAEDIDIFGHR